MNRHSLALLILFVFLLTEAVLAQGDPSPGSPESWKWYTSVGGIGAATVLIVGVLKRLVGNVAWLMDVPTWVYAVVVSAGLTYLANVVWSTLPGDTWDLMMQAVIIAAGASGFRSWYQTGGSAIGNSDTAIKARFSS